MAARSAVPQNSAIPQNDNVAHVLAGGGGGILSMALTYATPPRRRPAG